MYLVIVQRQQGCETRIMLECGASCRTVAPDQIRVSPGALPGELQHFKTQDVTFMLCMSRQCPGLPGTKYNMNYYIYYTGNIITRILQ